MGERKIKRINVQDVGYISAEREVGGPGMGFYHIEENPIEAFEVNGEVAPVTWYRQGKREFNGKYVLEIEYY